MNLSLKGKTALVCGSSGGIGKAIAIFYAEMGANVILLSRSEKKLDSVAELLPSGNGQQHKYIVCDLHGADNLKYAINEISKMPNTVDILVNNSGGPTPGPIFDATEDDFLQAFRSHLLAGQRLVRAFAPQMKANNWGSIINIISIALKQPIDGLGVSNTIRGAVAAWAKTLSRELGPFGITVNNLLPGYTSTPRLESLFNKRAADAGVTTKEISDKICSEIPAGRIGKPEEIAYAAGFLASDMAGYINGVSLPVDGGFLRAV